MTAKEKALELFQKFAKKWYEKPQDIKNDCLIAVNEIIKEVEVWKIFIKENTGHFDKSKYWQEVKEEINKL